MKLARQRKRRGILIKLAVTEKSQDCKRNSSLGKKGQGRAKPAGVNYGGAAGQPEVLDFSLQAGSGGRWMVRRGGGSSVLHLGRL